MAAFLATLGLISAKKDDLPPAERKSLAMVIAEKSSHTTSYMEKVAKDIVAQSPIFGKGRVTNIAKHRDKESLLVELIDLKKALEETEIHLHMHKQHYLRLLEETRRLEREVEELELRGNYDAPRTGGVIRLESKFKGLGAQVNILQRVVAERKYGELAQLRKDLGTTHTRETEVERDTVAAEILRLKILFDHMELLYKEAKEDNEKWSLCKRHFARLEVANPKVQQRIQDTNDMIKKARDEIAKLKKDGDDAHERRKELAKKDRLLEEKVKELSPKARANLIEKKILARKDRQVGYDKTIFNQEFRKDHPGILTV